MTVASGIGTRAALPWIVRWMVSCIVACHQQVDVGAFTLSVSSLPPRKITRLRPCRQVTRGCVPGLHFASRVGPRTGSPADIQSSRGTLTGMRWQTQSRTEAFEVRTPAMRTGRSPSSTWSVAWYTVSEGGFDGKGDEGLEQGGLFWVAQQIVSVSATGRPVLPSVGCLLQLWLQKSSASIQYGSLRLST